MQENEERIFTFVQLHLVNALSHNTSDLSWNQMKSINDSIKVRRESVGALSACERHVLKLGQTPRAGIFLLIYQPLSLSLSTAVCTANNLNCESVEGQNITMNNYLLLPWGRLFMARHSMSPHCTAEKSKAAEHKTSKTFYKKSQRGVWRVSPGCPASWQRSAEAYSSYNENNVIVNKKVCLFSFSMCL